jgi:hypothetical protein
MKIIKILSMLLVIAIGVFLFVYGEYDDSPGGQLIGIILVVIGIIRLIKIKKKNLK